MTYIDLLQYILNVQNVEKKDLARFIGTNPKKLDKILSGEKTLSKKSLKYLSAFTGIPAERIKNGMFSLAAPVEKNENEEGQTTEIDPVAEEYNRSRLLSFLKVRYKSDVISFSFANIIVILLAVLAIAASSVCFGVFCFAKPGVYIGMFSLSFILPSILFLVSSIHINKIRSKAHYLERKNYKIYSLFIILGIMLFNALTLYYDINNLPAFLVITAGAIMMLIDTVLRKPYSKTAFGEYFFTILSLAVMLFGYNMFLSVDTTQVIEETEAMQLYEIAAWFTSFALMMTYIAVECYTGYIRTTFSAYKHFMQIEGESVSEKKSVLKSVIAIILAFSIFSGAAFGFAVYVRKQTIEELRTTLRENTYKDYDKSHIVFSDKEETILVDCGNYTIELPAEFKEKKQEKESLNTVTTYYGKNEKAGVFIREYINVIPEGGFGITENMDEKEKAWVLEMQSNIEEKYGFYPKSMVEMKKMEKLVSENTEVNCFSRKDVTVEIYLGLICVVARPSEMVTAICEDDEKQISIQSYRVENGEKSRTLYDIEGNKFRDYDNGINIMGFAEDDYSDSDVIYKIINSIRFK